MAGEPTSQVVEEKADTVPLSRSGNIGVGMGGGGGGGGGAPGAPAPP